MKPPFRFYPLTILLMLCALAGPSTYAYDPLALGAAPRMEDMDLPIHGGKRVLPLRVYFPAQDNASAPLVLYSHGLGGSRQTANYLGTHWASRGYVVVFIQHPGSDESLWKGKNPLQAAFAMKHAANVENYALRVSDVKALIDQIAAESTQATSPFHHRVQTEHIGMSGHSFGARTTQALCGERLPSGSTIGDPRLSAAIVMSPSPAERSSPETSFGAVNIPWLVMTGTQDTSRIGNTHAQDRRKVFAALPPHDKYELVLDQAKHSAFTDREQGDRSAATRNPAHHRAILALSTAFWDAYLRGDPEAKAWLSQSARSVLTGADLWQAK